MGAPCENPQKHTNKLYTGLSHCARVILQGWSKCFGASQLPPLLLLVISKSVSEERSLCLSCTIKEEQRFINVLKCDPSSMGMWQLPADVSHLVLVCHELKIKLITISHSIFAGHSHKAWKNDIQDSPSSLFHLVTPSNSWASHPCEQQASCRPYWLLIIINDNPEFWSSCDKCEITVIFIFVSLS